MQADYEALYLKFKVKELSSSKYSVLTVNFKEKDSHVKYTVHTEINQFI